MLMLVIVTHKQYDFPNLNCQDTVCVVFVCFVGCTLTVLPLLATLLGPSLLVMLNDGDLHLQILGGKIRWSNV